MALRPDCSSGAAVIRSAAPVTHCGLHDACSCRPEPGREAVPPDLAARSCRVSSPRRRRVCGHRAAVACRGAGPGGRSGPFPHRRPRGLRPARQRRRVPRDATGRSLRSSRPCPRARRTARRGPSRPAPGAEPVRAGRRGGLGGILDPLRGRLGQRDRGREPDPDSRRGDASRPGAGRDRLDSAGGWVGEAEQAGARGVRWMDPLAARPGRQHGFPRHGRGNPLRRAVGGRSRARRRRQEMVLRSRSGLRQRPEHLRHRRRAHRARRLQRASPLVASVQVRHLPGDRGVRPRRAQEQVQGRPSDVQGPPRAVGGLPFCGRRRKAGGDRRPDGSRGGGDRGGGGSPRDPPCGGPACGLGSGRGLRLRRRFAEAGLGAGRCRPAHGGGGREPLLRLRLVRRLPGSGVRERAMAGRGPSGRRDRDLHLRRGGAGLGEVQLARRRRGVRGYRVFGEGRGAALGEGLHSGHDPFPGGAGLFCPEAALAAAAGGADHRV